MIAENTLTGIGFFGMQILHLISNGKSEGIQEIEKHFDDGDLVEYLSKKYDDYFYIKFDNSTYDNSAINKYFSNYSGFIEGNEAKKYGIMNEQDGLLLILALIFDKVEAACRTWTCDE